MRTLEKGQSFASILVLFEVIWSPHRMRRLAQIKTGLENKRHTNAHRPLTNGGFNPTLSAILVWLRRRSRGYVLVLVRKEEARRSRLPVTVPRRS
jgi:hypothetical protein